MKNIRRMLFYIAKQTPAHCRKQNTMKRNFQDSKTGWLFPEEMLGLPQAPDMAALPQDDVRLEVRNSSSLTEYEKHLLELSQLGDLGSVEAWTACGTNQQMAYSTHGAFRYFGKFHPPIATHLIGRYANTQDDVIFDPMSGSGTTGVEAMLAKKKCILNDISPLSVLLAKVKTTFMPEQDLRNAVKRVVGNYKPLSIEEYSFAPTHLRNYEHWFLPETIDSLRGIKYLIEQENDSKLKDFLNVCFAGTVRRVSRATTQQGRLFLDAESAEKDALPFFEKRAEIAIKGVSSLPRDAPAPIIHSLDLRIALPKGFNESAQLIICHPPYFNSYKYSSINSLELAWLGMDHSALRGHEVREFFKIGKEENARFYVDDMVEILANLHPTLKAEGHLALMIGDTMIHGNYIPVTKWIMDKINNLYDIEIVALRAPKYTEAAWVASQRRTGDKVGISLYDFVIVMRKKA